MAHSWVIAFHCLKTSTSWERLVRNGDSGIFFIITGLTTELSLTKWRDYREPDAAPIRFYLNYLRHRCLKVFLFTWTMAYIAYIIFPIRAGAGRHLLKYVFTGTLPLLERFDKNRIVWNPNPVHWFVCQLLWFWAAHPLVRFGLNRWIDQKVTRLVMTGCGLGLTCLVLCGMLHEYAEEFSGWSFHPLPRFLQYCFGLWLARALMMTPSVMEVNSARPYFFDTRRLLARHLSDVTFFIYVLIQSHGPKRYMDNWNAQWLWRTVGISPLLVISMYGIKLSETVVTSSPPASIQLCVDSEDETQASDSEGEGPVSTLR